MHICFFCFVFLNCFVGQIWSGWSKDIENRVFVFSLLSFGVSSNKYTLSDPMLAILPVVVCLFVFFNTPSSLQCDMQSNLEHSLSGFGHLEKFGSGSD